MGHRALCLFPYLRALLRAEEIELELAAVIEARDRFPNVKNSLESDLLVGSVFGYFDGSQMYVCLEKCRERYCQPDGDNWVLFYDASPAVNHVHNIAVTEKFQTHYLGEKPLILDAYSLNLLDVHIKNSRGRRLLCDFIETESLPFHALLGWIAEHNIRINRAHFVREAVGGLKKLLNPKSRAGVAGGCIVDKSIHDLSIAYALIRSGLGRVPARPKIDLKSFEAMPSSLEVAFANRPLFLSTQNTTIYRPIDKTKDVGYEIADAFARYSISSDGFEATFATSWVGVRSSLLRNSDAVLSVRASEAWNFVGEDYLPQRGLLPEVPVTDCRIAILEAEDGQKFVLDFMYKMKGGHGQRIWKIDQRNQVLPLETPTLEFGQNTLGRVLLKAIRRLSGTSGSEDFYFFDEDAVGWVHSTLVGVRRQGLDRLSNASAEDLTAGCRLVRENFRESSLDLGAFAKLRGLIVDLDNTLFRTQEAVPSIADLVKTIKKYYELDSLSDLEKRLWREGVSGILKDLRLRSGASAYEAETAVWGAYECLEIKNPIPMIPGWSALAKRLEKGDLKSALLTSGVWELQARKIKSVRGLQRVFRPIVIDDERCPLGKQRLIGAMLSEWNIEPRQVLIVGDNLKAEIAYGRDFGCKVAHVCVNGVCKSCETDLCCQDLKEVVSLLG